MQGVIMAQAMASVGQPSVEVVLDLDGAELARAQGQTIRFNLLKIGGVVVRHTRTVRWLWRSSPPYHLLSGPGGQAAGQWCSGLGSAVPARRTNNGVSGRMSE